MGLFCILKICLAGKYAPKENAINSIIILDDQGLMKLIDAAF